MLELHIWGPAFELPSIDAECIAAIAYLKQVLPHELWVLIVDHDASSSPSSTYSRHNAIIINVCPVCIQLT